MCRDHWFKNSNPRSAEDVTDKPDVLSHTDKEMDDQNINVTVSDISVAIKGLPEDKSPGMDLLPDT